MADEPGNTTSLQPLIERLNAGDQKALDPLFAMSMERLRALAGRMLRDDRMRRWYETDDLYQRTMTDLLRMLREQPPQTAREFLNIAAWKMRNCLTDLAREVRKNAGGLARQHETDHPLPGRDQDAPRLAGAADDGPDPAAGVSLDLHQTVGLLPDELREVFNLLFYLGLTQDEAAKVMEVSVPTVKRRWREARERLEELIAR